MPRQTLLRQLLGSCLLLLLVPTGPARATVRAHPLVADLVLEREVQPEAGVPQRATVVLWSPTGASLEQLELGGDSWATSWIDAPGLPRHLAAGERLELRVELEWDGRDGDLELRATASGETSRRSWAPSGLVPPRSVATATGQATGEPSPAPRPGPAGGVDAAPHAHASSSSSSFNVSGRLVFHRGVDQREMPADGATIQAWDVSGLIPSYLGEGTAGEQGDFSFTASPCLVCNPIPVVELVALSSNSKVFVSPSGTGLPFRWSLGSWLPPHGSTLDAGELRAEGSAMPLFIVHVLTRMWYFLLTEAGDDLPVVHVRWSDPSANTAYYSGGLIVLEPNNAWEERVLMHEYGHHYVNILASDLPPEYCGGGCDQTFGFCCHTGWCAELSEDIGWTEGFPNFLADRCTAWWAESYSLPMLQGKELEALQLCPETGQLGGPRFTEDVFGAFLVDIADSSPDADPLTGNRWYETMAEGIAPVLQVARLDDPVTPMQFLADFRARYPSLDAQTWVAAANNGYAFADSTPPVLTALRSSSHSPGVPSPNPQVSLRWDGDDDWSGYRNASVVWALDAPFEPNLTPDLVDGEDSYTSPVLADGNWYFTVRIVDDAGNWSASQWVGPYVVDQPEGPDLEAYDPLGWAGALVPRNDTVDPSSVGPSLSPLTTNSYWNLALRNHGDSTMPSTTNRVLVDGVAVDDITLLPLAADGVIHKITNRGPVAVPGGRHTLGVRLDDAHAAAEPDEEDNRWARQWSWLPLPFLFSTEFDRPAPPFRDGGWADVPSGSLWYNCDGLRFLADESVQPNAFVAVTMTADLATVDYDIRLHEATTSATAGFDWPLERSSRPAGCTDVLVTNALNESATMRDVGVISAGGLQFGGYRAEVEYGEPIAAGGSASASLSTGELSQAWSLALPPTSLGSYTVSVVPDPGEGPLRVAHFGPSLVRGTLDDATGVASSPGDGEAARISFAATEGLHGFLVFRDRRDGALGSLDFTIRVDPSLPNLVPGQPAGWAWPLVPRADDLATAMTAPAPAALFGDQPLTWINMAWQNVGPNNAGWWVLHHQLDGANLATLLDYGTAAGAIDTWLRPDPIVVPGGLHLLSMEANRSQGLGESSYDDNIHGRQFRWEPSQVTMNGRGERELPPERTGGWQFATDGGPLFYNCDGLAPTGLADDGVAWNWTAFAVLPDPGADVDLRLHPPGNGTGEGFRQALASSAWPGAAIDFLVADAASMPAGPYELGILRGGGAPPARYRYESVTPFRLGASPDLSLDLTIGSDVLMRLLEFTLDEETRYRVDVVGLDATETFGVSWYEPGAGPRNKSAVLDDGQNGPAIAWEESGAAGAGFDVVAAPGTHAVALWRVAGRDPSPSTTARVVLQPTSPTGTGPLPGRTGIAGIAPNPFNPGTRVHFELATSGRVELEVVDARGRRVRRLWSGPLPAGRHEQAWDGRDDQGLLAASGNYYLHLRGPGGSTDRAGMTLLK